MLNKLSIIFIVLLSVSCNSNIIDNTPKNVLSVNKMANVMLDVHLLEATLSISLYTKDSVITKHYIPSIDILAKHDITKDIYLNSFNYYTLNLDSLDRILELVLIDLTKLKSEVNDHKE